MNNKHTSPISHIQKNKKTEIGSVIVTVNLEKKRGNLKEWSSKCSRSIPQFNDIGTILHLKNCVYCVNVNLPAVDKSVSFAQKKVNLIRKREDVADFENT